MRAPVRWRPAAAAVAAAALGLAACGGGRAGHATATTGPEHPAGVASATTVAKPARGHVLLGFLGPLTGPDARLGVAEKQGVELALQQYSATAPPVTVTLDAVDTRGDPGRAAVSATAVVGGHVAAVIGPALSSVALAAGPFLAQAGIPAISPSAADVGLAQHGWEDFHRVVADDSVQGRGNADYLVRTLGDKTVAVIDDASPEGAEVAGYVRTQLEANGGVDALDVHIDPAARDDGAVVAQVIDVGPQAVFFDGDPSAAGRLLAQLRTGGYTGSFLAGVRAGAPAFLAAAGGAAHGAYLSCGCADTSHSASALPFESAYRAAFGVPPAPYAVEAYDATNAVLAAIKAGVTAPTAINLFLDQSSWTGVSRTVKFWPDGNLSGGTTYISQVKADTVVPVGTSG